MTDAEIIALAVRYYKAGQARHGGSRWHPDARRKDSRDAGAADTLRLRRVGARRSGPVHREDGAAGGHRDWQGQDGSAPFFLGWAVVDIARMLDGDRERAARLVNAAFEKGVQSGTSTIGFCESPRRRNAIF